MEPKEGLALLLTPHGDGDGDEDDYEATPEEMEAARAFYEAGEKKDWKAAASALCSFVDQHTDGHGGGKEEDKGEEPGEAS